MANLVLLPDSVRKQSKYLPIFESWKYWCRANNIRLETYSTSFSMPVWERNFIFEDYNLKPGDKIALVGVDRMIKWNAPNFFEMYSEELCGVHDNDSYKVTHSSIKQYRSLFEDTNLNVYNYLNTGIILLHTSHRAFFDVLTKFYKEHVDSFAGITPVEEQTLFNYLLQQHNIEEKYLTAEWNLLGMAKRGMFTHNWQLNEDTTPFFIKYSYIWHISNEYGDQILDQVWKYVRQNYR